MSGQLPKDANIDLGLAILAATTDPPHTLQTIANYCGCSRQAIERIEKIALRKLRKRLYSDKELARDLSPTLGKGLS